MGYCNYITLSLVPGAMPYPPILSWYYGLGQNCCCCYGGSGGDPVLYTLTLDWQRREVNITFWLDLGVGCPTELLTPTHYRDSGRFVALIGVAPQRRLWPGNMVCED